MTRLLSKQMSKSLSRLLSVLLTSAMSLTVVGITVVITNLCTNHVGPVAGMACGVTLVPVSWLACIALAYRVGHNYRTRGKIFSIRRI